MLLRDYYSIFEIILLFIYFPKQTILDINLNYLLVFMILYSISLAIYNIFLLTTPLKFTLNCTNVNCTKCIRYTLVCTKYEFYCNKVNITPAATAVPITPATFGPMACINRKLLGFASCPTF